jgi:hypothetical protein
MNNNKCKIVNIVWIDRGMLISIIYYIVMKHKSLLKKNIILSNDKYYEILKNIFPKMNFKIYDMEESDGTIKNNKNNFYINIRTIMNKQDLIIDYLHNYKKHVCTKKIYLVPWYDMNDPLIMYKYDNNYRKKIVEYKNKLYEFSGCKRSDYNGETWDNYKETYIIKKYMSMKKKNRIENIKKYFNDIVREHYIDTMQTKIIKKIINVPVVEYVDRPVDRIVEKIVEKPVDRIVEKIVEVEKFVYIPTNENEKAYEQAFKLVEERLNITNEVLMNI